MLLPEPMDNDLEWNNFEKLNDKMRRSDNIIAIVCSEKLVKRLKWADVHYESASLVTFVIFFITYKHEAYKTS